MLTCMRQVDLPRQYYILCPYHNQKRPSTVRVKRPPSVQNKRRTRRRIPDEEMGLEEAPSSHGQDEQGAEDIREVSAGCRQDKQGAEDVREVPTDCGQDKQDPGNARQAPAGHRQSRVGPELPQGFQDKLD